MDYSPVHLIFVDDRTRDGVDHNKFYDMFVKGNEIHCLYGRVKDGYVFGKSGKLATYPLYEWESIYRSKCKKGYKDMSILYRDALTAPRKSDDTYAPIQDPLVATIMDRLQDYAKQTIRANYQITPTQVTQIMISEVQNYLNLIVGLLNSDYDDQSKLYNINQHLLQIFRTIPRSMNRVDAFFVRQTSDIGYVIDREQKLLDVMQGQLVTSVKGQKIQTKDGSKKTILELNGIEMSAVRDSDTLWNIQQRLKGATVVDAWEINHLQNNKNFYKYLQDENLTKQDVRLVWHGTRNENVFNVLKTGLLIKPTNVITTGSMFGNGIYLAPDAFKSKGYTSLSGSRWAQGSSSTGFLLLCEVIYGTPALVYDFNPNFYSYDYRKLRANHPNTHCLHASASRGMLRADEIVVYKESQVLPKFLVEIC